jgi:hypothetical protein
MRIDTGVITMFICDTTIAQDNESNLRDNNDRQKGAICSGEATA